jgi:phytoene desaturase
MSKRVVIVGAGPGGLAAAMLLARSGVEVQLLERQPHIGGRTSALRAGGFRFDLGPTFFLYPRVLAEIFAAVGRDLHCEVELVRLDPQYRLVFGAGGQLDATPRIERMEQAIAAIAPSDATSFRRFLDDNRHKLARFRDCLERPFLGWRDLFTWPLLRLLPLLSPWRSLDGELARYFSDPRIRLAFSFQSKYLGMSPFRCPSLFSILSFLEYEHGVWHPIGGCSAVTAAMARIAIDLGVDIHTGEDVQEVLFEGRKAVGVRTSRGTYRSDALVINADFGRAMCRLVPDQLRRRWTDRRIAKKRYSCSTFMLYLGLDGSCDELPHHTIYMPRDYVRNLEEIEKRHVLSEDPSFYVQNATVTDRALAPRGKSTLYVLVPVTHQHPNVDWQREAPRFREVALRQLARIGLWDIERRIEYEHQITPADWERQHQIYRGATFNLAHNLGQLLHLRPRNRFEDLERTYLVGGGTHPGSGLPVIFESARITSRLLLQDLGLPYDCCVVHDSEGTCSPWAPPQRGAEVPLPAVMEEVR